MSKKLILIGGGGHCKSCIDVIEQAGQYKIVGILDNAEHVGEKVLDYNIIGTDDQIEKLAVDGYTFLITIGQIRSSQLREKLFNALVAHNADIATIISPRAYISKYAEIGEGTIVMHDALVNADARIGKNCIINSKALIEHDSTIQDHCHISTGAIINGGVKVEKNCFIGSKVTTKEAIIIRTGSFIKAGSIVK